MSPIASTSFSSGLSVPTGRISSAPVTSADAASTLDASGTPLGLRSPARTADSFEARPALERATTLSPETPPAGSSSVRDLQLGRAQASTSRGLTLPVDRQSVVIGTGGDGPVLVKAADLKGLVDKVPDPETGLESKQWLDGRFIFGAAQNPRTKMVAIGVRGRLFGESDYSMVFVVNPARPESPRLLKLVAPGEAPAQDGSTAAFGTIRGIRYDDAGRLHIEHGGADDVTRKAVFNPDLSVYRIS